MQLDSSIIERAEQAAHERVFRFYSILFSRACLRFKGDAPDSSAAAKKAMGFVCSVERSSQEHATTSFAECFGELKIDEVLAAVDEIDGRSDIFRRAVNWCVAMVKADRIIELEHAIETLETRDLYGVEAMEYLESVQSPISLVH